MTAFTFRVETPWTSHLGQARRERLLGALVALEQLGREAPVPVPRHPQLQLADPGDQGPAVVARAVAEPAGAALALAGAERVRHLGLQHLLQHRAHDLAQPVGVAPAYSLAAATESLAWASAMAGFLGSWRRQTPPACHGHPPFRPVPLALSSAVTGPDPRNLVRIILDGIRPPEGEAGPMMPGFAGALTDQQVTALVAYVRSHFASAAAWEGAADRVREIRQEGRPA